MFHPPDNLRSREIEAALSHSVIWESKNDGAFFFGSNVSADRQINCISSDGMGWEHVSVSVNRGNQMKTPVWEEMCLVKSLFWDSEDVVVQYHPAASDYVNHQENTLHLWRPIGVELPKPDPALVGGPGKKMSASEAAERT